jgi:hypothetical protein
VTITVPSDAHFVHVSSNVTLFSATAAANMTVWITETTCSAAIVEATRAFGKLETTTDVIDLMTQGVFSAAAGAHTYHYCLITGGSMDSGWIHIAATTEALNGTGGTSAPVEAASRSSNRSVDPAVAEG